MLVELIIARLRSIGVVCADCHFVGCPCQAALVLSPRKSGVAHAIDRRVCDRDGDGHRLATVVLKRAQGRVAGAGRPESHVEGVPSGAAGENADEVVALRNDGGVDGESNGEDIQTLSGGGIAGDDAVVDADAAAAGRSIDPKAAAVARRGIAVHREAGQRRSVGERKGDEHVYLWRPVRKAKIVAVN